MSHYVRNPEDRFCSVKAHILLATVVLEMYNIQRTIGLEVYLLS